MSASKPNKKGLVLGERQRIEGFTLIELLVVISIIAILSVIGVTVFSGVQKSARNTKRIADMKAIQQALEVYYNVNNSTYPNPGGGWRGECNHPWGTGGLSSDQVIPGLVPQYMVSFPADPAQDKVLYKSCYLYQSSGADYKLLDHRITELSQADYQSNKTFVDPLRDGGPSNSSTTTSCNGSGDGSNIWSWAVYSPGARCW